MIPVQARAQNPVAFPSFMTFDFDPERGPNLSIKPYQKSPKKEPMIDSSKAAAAVEIVGRNAITGTVVGVGVGVICFTVGAIVRVATRNVTPSPSEDESSNDSTTTAIGAGTLMAIYSLGKYAFVGGLIGGAAGTIRGVRVASKIYLDPPKVINATLDASVKAKGIIQAFVDSRITRLSQADDIEIACPITRDIMVYPVDIHCGSNIPHTFEFFNILKWLQRVPRCPTCNGEVNIRNLTLDEQKERKIHYIVGVIFKKMEAILQRLPKQDLNGDAFPDFFEPQNISTLAAMIEKGKPFLSGDIRKITAKINKPDKLSLEETFALGHFLVHQFKPLKHKIDQIYQILTTKLVEMRTQGKMDGEALATQFAQVQRWYETFDVIPEKCKIIRKLYQIEVPQ